MNVESVEFVCSCLNGVNMIGNYVTVYYCEVTDDMKVSKGERKKDGSTMVDTVEMTEDEVKEYCKDGEDVLSPAPFLFGVYWFFMNKFKQCE